MGIYPTYDVYGIRIIIRHDFDDVDVLFHLETNDFLTREQKRNIRAIYENLSHAQKRKVEIFIYTPSPTTLTNSNDDVSNMWFPLPLTMFLEKCSFL